MMRATQNVPVLTLPSKTNVEQFSIDTPESPSLVTIYHVSKSGKKVVRCHKGSCNVHKGNKRPLRNLGNSNNICGHLKVLRNHFWVFTDGDCNDEDGDVDSDNEVDVVLPQEKVGIMFNPYVGLPCYY